MITSGSAFAHTGAPKMRSFIRTRKEVVPRFPCLISFLEHQMVLLSNQPDAVIHDLKRRKVVTSLRACPDRPIMKQCNLSTILAARYPVTV
jgi:hypothetical protein